MLEPGGRFVVVDFHPIERMFDREWNHVGPYFPPAEGRVDTHTEGVIDYVTRTPGRVTPFAYETGIVDFQNPRPCHTFAWGLGEIVTAVASAGLRVETLPEDVPSVPLLYGLCARKL